MMMSMSVCVRLSICRSLSLCLPACLAACLVFLLSVCPQAQNGLAVFCCWSLLEALVVLGQVLCYVGGFPDPMISSIIFLLILLFIKVW